MVARNLATASAKEAASNYQAGRRAAECLTGVAAMRLRQKDWSLTCVFSLDEETFRNGKHCDRRFGGGR
jgi:hypothetical protein